MSLSRRSTALLLLAALATSCTPIAGKRYSRDQAQKSLAKLEQPGLTLGEFTMTKVVDGDTIRVDGLDSSLRLLGIDTEETFKNNTDRRDMEADWNKYVESRRNKHRPGRIATPMGEQAKLWAKHFFEGVKTVRLERDHPKEIRDRFKRYLAYVFVQKNGVWVNYNVECVRAGMAPYYTKYGYSRRFHKELQAAMAEAQAAKRGIWADNVLKYPDYDARFAWWTPRADFIDEFRKAGEGKDNFIDVGQWDSVANLDAHVGKEVNVLGVVGDVIIGEKGPSRVTLSRSMFNDLPLVFFDRDVLGTSGLAEWKGEYVWITGVPTVYENTHTHRKQTQIVIERTSQVKLSRPPGLTPPTIGGNAP
ncbi:MAG TPA: thermonuclease family protein [Kofleriaceae bacterium]|jgi:endonuclease YncB( thermonuclease family)